MKLYTRTGDDGTTSLFSGTRVSKNHPRIEAYGCVDELNAAVGMAAAAFSRADPHAPAGWSAYARRTGEILHAVQSRLFDLGADLATPPGGRNEERIQRVDDAAVAEAERWIDETELGNVPIRTFVLPGGSEEAARLHVARTVCRRAEREVIRLAQTEPVGEPVIRFLNRVSDLMFAMARRANRERGVPDVPWTPSRPTAG